MSIEPMRRLWTHPASRWWHRAAGVADRAAGGVDGRARPEFDFDGAQAQALADLVADPDTGITRVTVVGASPGLLDAVEDVAAARGLVLDEERRAAGGSRCASLEREATGGADWPADGLGGVEKDGRARGGTR
jgi:hypothetical protein